MTDTTWAFVRLLLRVIVTVPLPATMEPVTLVVLQPAPVHTEIGSAFAVAWVKARIPNTATGSNRFLRFENLGISRLLRIEQFRHFQAAALEADLDLLRRV